MKKPNVLYIMADQFHADCMSHAGRQVRTPNLDGLAADGAVFERAYCNNPICAPSRICFVTGQYVHTHGVQGNRTALYPRRNSDTFPALFRRSGYRTALTGKAHMPRLWNEEGFEHLAYTDLIDADPRDPLTNHYFAYLDERGLANWYEEGTERPGQDGTLLGTHPADLPYEHSIERFTGDRTLAFLQEGRDAGDERPFLIHMSFQRPHSPIRPAREYFDLYDPAEIELPPSAVDWFERHFAGKPAHMVEMLRGGRTYPLANDDPMALKTVLAAYYALITCIDMEIGRVVQWLKDHGEYDNTIFVFTADHGDFAGDHGLFHKNFGIYESIHRIPFLFRYPGGQRGVRTREIIESVDLYPSLCELAGLQAPAGVEGRSFLPILRDGAKGKDEALAEWSWGGGTRTNALRTDRYRLVYYNRQAGGELYDHQTDPGEIENLWNDPAHADVRRELTERLFDRVNSYRAAQEMRDDAAIGRAERFLPGPLVQFGTVEWEQLRQAYSNPTPGRGPVG